MIFLYLKMKWVRKWHHSNVDEKQFCKNYCNQESILPYFFSSLMIIFSIFAIMLGHFIVDTFLFICYKQSSLTAKIGKQRKTNRLQVSSINDLSQRVCVLELLHNMIVTRSKTRHWRGRWSKNVIHLSPELNFATTAIKIF